MPTVPLGIDVVVMENGTVGARIETAKFAVAVVVSPVPEASTADVLVIPTFKVPTGVVVRVGMVTTAICPSAMMF